MTNYLATATKKTTVVKAKREPVRQPVAGLEYYTAFVEVSKAVGSLVEADKAAVKGGLEAQFIEAGCKAGTTPENFYGIEGLATASVQLRRKTVNSPLTNDEVRELNAHDIPMKHIAATFQISEKYMEDIALLDKLNKALAKAGLPTDLFEQNSEERHIVTDETVAAIFKKGSNLASKLIPLVAIVAIRPEWNGEFGEALSMTISELGDYSKPVKTIEAKAATAPKAQHIPAAAKSVSEAKAKPVAAQTVVAAKVKLTPAKEQKLADEGFRPDSVTAGGTESFKKGQWVWANHESGGAYLAQVVKRGFNASTVRWIDSVNEAVINTEDMTACNVPVTENVAA